MTTGTVAGHATSTAPGADGLVEQVVVFHVYTWLTLRPASLGVPGSFDHHRAWRGDHIWVSDEEAARGKSYGALADVDDAAAGIAAVDALGEPATDEELRAMSGEELIAEVTQHPQQAQRVYEIEAERSRPRVGVMRATGYEPMRDDDGKVTGWQPLPAESPHPADDGDPAAAGPAAVG
jgi:hypothetical protein